MDVKCSGMQHKIFVARKYEVRKYIAVRFGGKNMRGDGELDISLVIGST